MVRANESSGQWARSERIYSDGELWFFHTREGIDVGPYPSRATAADEVERFARMHRRARRAART
jgi:hypothetical protein